MGGTIIVEATSDDADLARRLSAVLAYASAGPQPVLVVCGDGERRAIELAAPGEFPRPPLKALPEGLPQAHLPLLLEAGRRWRGGALR
jgi:hypothetical protein